MKREKSNIYCWWLLILFSGEKQLVCLILVQPWALESWGNLELTRGPRHKCIFLSISLLFTLYVFISSLFSSFQAVIVKDIPQQMNGSDCGMFTCKFAEYLSRNANISFTQEDMPYFRKRMIYEIVQAKLMHPWKQRTWRQDKTQTGRNMKKKKMLGISTLP